jgi:hypothetical protein
VSRVVEAYAAVRRCGTAERDGFEAPVTDSVSLINFPGTNLKWDYGFFPEKLIID